MTPKGNLSVTPKIISTREKPDV